MANNPNNLILGGAAFGFNLTLPESDPDKKASYSVDFGNIKSCVLKTESEKKEHYGMYAGVAKRDRIMAVKKKMSYEMTLDEFGAAVWAQFMGSATGAAPDPAKVVIGYGWVAAEMESEPVNTTSDAGLFMHHSFRCFLTCEGDITLDGENFAECKLMVDVDLGVPGLWSAATRPVSQTE